MVNEPIIWVCVGVFLFLFLAIIKAKYFTKIIYISDNSTDISDELSEHGSIELA